VVLNISVNLRGHIQLFKFQIRTLLVID